MFSAGARGLSGRNADIPDVRDESIAEDSRLAIVNIQANALGVVMMVPNAASAGSSYTLLSIKRA